MVILEPVVSGSVEFHHSETLIPSIQYKVG